MTSENMAILKKNKVYFGDKALTADKVEKEIEQGLALLESVKAKVVSFFGSHTIPEGDPRAIHAHDLAMRLGEKGFAICTGGGPGIMKAANTGAIDAGVPSIGLKEALLQGEQGVDKKFFTHEFAFEFMFVRRFALSIKSHALVFYPGGFGTLNELFEYIVLMQTKIADQVPVICVGKEFWEGLFEWSAKHMIDDSLIKKEHLKLISIVDDIDDVVKLIK